MKIRVETNEVGISKNIYLKKPKNLNLIEV